MALVLIILAPAGALGLAATVPDASPPGNAPVAASGGGPPSHVLVVDTPSGPVTVDAPAASVTWARDGRLRMLLDVAHAPTADPLLYDPPGLAEAGAIREDGSVRVLVHGELPPLPASARRLTVPVPLDAALVEAAYEDVLALAHAPGVTRVEPALVLHPALDESVPLVRAPDAWNRSDAHGHPLRGDGVVIAIIDTGIDYTHPDLGGCFGTGCKVAGGYDFVNDDTDPIDDIGHGTHVAATAAGARGVAPNATLLAFKVCASNGCEGADIVAAIRAAVDAGAHVISMSLGAAVNGDGTDYLSREVDAARDAGVVVVTSAGNAGPGAHTVGIPAVARGAIAVGATDKADAPADFSSRGPTRDFRLKPDVTAPGVSITAALPGERTGTYSGTSMSAPHVSGAAAILLQAHPEWTPETVRSALAAGAHDLGLAAIVQGHGRLDIAGALDARVLAEPAHVDFGDLAGAVDATRSFDVTNPGPGNVTVTFHVPADAVPRNVTLTLEPVTLHLPPGETARVDVRLAFDADVPFPFTAVPVTAKTGADAPVSVPVTFARPYMLNVSIDAGDLYWACGVHEDGLDATCAGGGKDVTALALQVYAPGTYGVVARALEDPWWQYNSTILVREGVPVPGTAEVAFRPAAEHVPVAWDHVRADGTRPARVADEGFQYAMRYSPHPDVALLHTGSWALQDMHVTPASEAFELVARAEFREDGTTVVHDWNTHVRGFRGDPFVVVPDPARYREVPMDSASDPGAWSVNACSWINLNARVRYGWCGGFTVTGPTGGSEAPAFVVQPVDALLEPWPEHFPGFRASVDTDFWWHDAPRAYSSDATQILRGPEVRVLESGVRNTYFDRDVGAATLPLTLVNAPLAWTGRIAGNVVSNANETRGDFRWFTTPGSGVLYGPAYGPGCGYVGLRYRVTDADGVEEAVLPVEEPQGGCWVWNRAWLTNRYGAPRVIHLAPDLYTRAGVDLAVNLTQVATYGHDAAPPFVLDALLRDAAGRATTTFRDVAGATYALTLGDEGAGVDAVSAWVRPAGRNGTDWREVPVHVSDDRAVARFPALPDGVWALRVRVTDHAGNAAQWDLDPAFRVNVTLPRATTVHDHAAYDPGLQCRMLPRALCTITEDASGPHVDVRGLAGHRFTVTWTDDYPPVTLPPGGRMDVRNTDVRACFRDAAGHALGECQWFSWIDARHGEPAEGVVPAGAASVVLIAQDASATITFTLHAERGVLPQTRVPFPPLPHADDDRPTDLPVP